MEQDWETRVLRKSDKSSRPSKPSKSSKPVIKEEPEVFTHKEITHSFKVSLMRARQAKKLTQKQLADQINVKHSVINDYESGKIVPDGNIINKLNRALGIKLPKLKKI